MTLPDPKYKLGAVVFHLTDAQPGVVLAYLVFKTHIGYLVSWGTCNEEAHLECELTGTRPDWEASYDKAGAD